MSPYRQQHSCLVNEQVVKNLEPKKVKTKVGEIWVVMGQTADGKTMPRSIRFPAEVPVSIAQSMCNQRGGKFEPATPIDPKKQMLSEEYGFNEMSKEAKKLILSSLVENFEMPGEVNLAKWRTASVNDLPDSAFIVVLPGGKKDESGKTVPRSLRLLPYKNASGQIDKVHVRNALARVNQIGAPASVKKTALAKLLRIARALGMQVQEREKFRLSDLTFYLDLLESLGG